jgi:hypothetical protein
VEPNTRTTIPIPQTEAQRLRAALEAVVGASDREELIGIRGLMEFARSQGGTTDHLATIDSSMSAVDALLAEPIPDHVCATLIASRDSVMHVLDECRPVPGSDLVTRALFPYWVDPVTVMVNILAAAGDYTGRALDAAGIRDYEGDFNAVADLLGVGSAARTRDTVLQNVRNLMRRDRCLSAVELQFFTVHHPAAEGIDGDEASVEERLNWGDEPEAYAARFREELPAALLRAHGFQGDEAPQPIATAPRDGRSILAWWPIVEIDSEDQPTQSETEGHWLLTEWNGGHWLEPNVLSAIGAHMDDDCCYALEPTWWLPVPANIPPKTKPEEPAGLEVVEAPEAQ